MSSYEYIESALVFGINDTTSLRKFKYSADDFAKHGDAYRFIMDYYDNHKEFPNDGVLQDSFPTLDYEARATNFDFALDAFKSQVLQRKIIKTIQAQKGLVEDNPHKALTNIMSGLAEVEIEEDDSIMYYDGGTLDRFEEYASRVKKRQLGDGMIGIPTSFKTLNSTGVGWQAGELVSVFARPTIGKTWMCVDAAVTAVMEGFKTLLISTEMSARAINLRTDVVMAHKMGYKLSHSALRRGEEIEQDTYKKFLKESNNRRLLVCDHIEGQSGISLESIAGLIRKHTPDFVVIDGVYLISTNTKSAMWEQSHALFYGLKNLCTSMDTCIFVSTQANRDAANMFSPPRADQVAFGDALIRASDVVLAMCAMEDDKNKRLVQFQKYRDDDVGVDLAVMQWNINNGESYEDQDYDWGDF